jgi:hypothetical protein
MARIVIVLICGVLVFILVSRFAPHFIETYLPSAATGEEVAESETPDTKTEPAKKKSAATNAKSGTASRPSARTAATPPVSAAPALVPASAAAGKPADVPGAPTRSVVQVTSENATVYLTNTTGGPVVGRLTKGAVVEPVFVVSSAGQNWTFVSASNEELAGFMRSDTLGRGRIAISAAK